MDGEMRRIRELEDRLEELDRLIRRLDPAVRAALIELLAPYRSRAGATGGASARLDRGRPVAAAGTPGSLGSAGVLRLASARPQTPGDNVILCSAMILAEQGTSELTATAIRARAEAMGLRVPRDPLRTLRLAREGGPRCSASRTADGASRRPAGRISRSASVSGCPAPGMLGRTAGRAV